jgi:hypothetical protein
MTVRMTQTESGSTPQSDAPHLNHPEPTDSPPSEPRTDGRRALREARRHRRRLAVGCALLVAVCLVITILIVDLARNRASGPQGAAPAFLRASHGPIVRPAAQPVMQAIEIRGAPAPEGGNR